MTIIKPVESRNTPPSSPLSPQKPRGFPWTTAIFVGFFLIFIILGCAWAGGEPHLVAWFAAWDQMQLNPPSWISVPTFEHSYQVFLPLLLLMAGLYLLMKISPEMGIRVRIIFSSVAAVVTLRYFLWRALATLNLATPLEGIASIVLLLMEGFYISDLLAQLYMLLSLKDRRAEADRWQQQAIAQGYRPSVDILVPTYNEPVFILRRTIIACQALAYANKQVFLLDDSRRPEMAQLAQELSCHYITRPNNSFAKAGNLNHALDKTQGELIAVFDADFMPTQNFLSRTVGFFLNPNMGLLQTQQHFYNADPVSRNLYQANTVPNEGEMFGRYLQPLWDGIGLSICNGSSFVMRRQHLEAVGGFDTQSLAEDFLTGMRLNAAGYDCIYLDEKLSAGLAPENMSGHLLQRMRWMRGTLQSFFVKAGPMTLKGLKLWERLFHVQILLSWFISMTRVIFFLLPISSILFNVTPLRITYAESVYFLMPYFVLDLMTFAWRTKRSRSSLMTDIYTVLHCFPLALTSILIMLCPFSGGFQVTPKGLSRERYAFNWQLAWPLMLMFGVTAIALIKRLDTLINHPELMANTDSSVFQSLQLVWFGGMQNILVLGVVLVILVEIPKPHIYEYFKRRYALTLKSDHQQVAGETVSISEVKALIQTQGQFTVNETLELHFAMANLTVLGRVSQVHRQSDGTVSITVEYERLTDSQYRRLVWLLFCQPGQWDNQPAPKEWRALLITVATFLRPVTFPIQQAHQRWRRHKAMVSDAK